MKDYIYRQLINLNGKDKPNKRRPLSRRLGLRNYLGEVLPVKGRVVNFGHKKLYGLTVSKDITVLFHDVETVHGMCLSHVWVTFPPNVIAKIHKGDVIKFYATVIVYEASFPDSMPHTQTIYKYGFKFDESRKFRFL